MIITTEGYLLLISSRVVSDNNKFVGARSNNLFLSQATASTLDQSQVAVTFISTINSHVQL